MFTVNNAGENSRETYKLSSDVGAYIFVLLKKSYDWFSVMRHFKSSSNIAKPTFCRFHSILACFLVRKCRGVGVWAVKAMFYDKPLWHHVQVYDLEYPYTHYFALSRTRKHCRIEWKQQKVGFATLDDSAKCFITENQPQ